MEVTLATWSIAIAGLVIMSLLFGLQLVAVFRPRSRWTIEHVYGGSPDSTDPRAYFAWNRGMAWADVLFLAPLQFAGGVGMLLGHRWGFLLALMASVPFWYTAILVFVWDRDLNFRRNTFSYWVLVWGIFPVFGLLEGAYCLGRLLG